MRLTILGSGTSTGIPEYRCNCETCQDARKPGSKNYRTRPSMHLQVGETHLQFDTGPNFLEQIDRHGVERIDAVLYTHCHADHIAGTNDLVMPCRKQKTDMPVYGPGETMGVLRRNFEYLFLRNVFQGGGVAHLVPNGVDGPFQVDGVSLVPVPVTHGTVETFGYRVGPLAYVSDVKEMPRSSLELLEGVQVLIVDALSFNPKHPTHQSVGQAVALSRRLRVERTYLTHMMHRVDHRFFKDQCKAQDIDLPDNVALSYDGQTIDV